MVKYKARRVELGFGVAALAFALLIIVIYQQSTMLPEHVQLFVMGATALFLLSFFVAGMIMITYKRRRII